MAFRRRLSNAAITMLLRSGTWKATTRLDNSGTVSNQKIMLLRGDSGSPIERQRFSHAENLAFSEFEKQTGHRAKLGVPLSLKHESY